MTGNEVLVLNAAYQPINLVSWQDAMIKLHALNANERVEIVSTYSDRVIRSAHAEHPMPCVCAACQVQQQEKIWD
jgi:hypothetical protein